MPYPQSDVALYLQMHGIPLIFQTLSGILLTHRPEQPWKFLSACLEDAMRDEARLAPAKRKEARFSDMLEAAVPLPPLNHVDGRPVTPLESRADNLQLYADRHEVKKTLEQALEALIVADLPQDPRSALKEYFSDLANSNTE